jgi:hypothetical protein
MDYSATYLCSDGKYVRQYSFTENTDKRKSIEEELQVEFAQDPKYKLQYITVHDKNIDYDLLDRMRAVREMCELGHKVRAGSKIRNRQPLRNAYVAFSDRAIQDYMVYIDCNKNQYADIIGDELNILNVEFIDAAIEAKIFNYNIKPNFRSLGPKGFGKQAQKLKTHIAAMDSAERNTLHTKLRDGEIVSLLDVPLTYNDIEVEFCSKEGYISSSGKVGAIVLDTKIDESLSELGFIAEFRSAVQNIRKTANLELTDKIFLEIFCEARRVKLFEKFRHKLEKDLLATGMKFFPPCEVDITLAHRFYLHNGSLKTDAQIKESNISTEELEDEMFFINIYKEAP